MSFALGALAAVLAARRRRSLLAVTALLGLMGATTAGVTSARVRRVERRWDDVREQLIKNASDDLAGTLESTVSLARSLADRGAAAAATASQAVARVRLERALPSGGPEAGVVVLETDGRPWIWSGRHRLPPSATGDELDARITPFYVVLEARRQAGSRIAVGRVLIAADSAIPDRGRAMASRFSRRTGAALEFYRPGRAPLGSDVFDYCLPSCAAGASNPAPDTLFSIRTVPPAQGSYKLALLESGGRAVTFGALLCLIGLLAVGEIRTRYLALALTGALLPFTPAGARAGLASFFSPATYYWAAFDPLTASAGALFLTSVIAMVAIVALRIRPVPRAAGVIAGGIVALVAPFVARALARGISPPPAGVGLGLWLGWEISLAVAAAALVLLVAALLPQPVRHRNWAAGAAVAWGAAAALVGIFVWRPEASWPAWYAWVWLPAILLAARAGNRARQVVAAGLVGGSAAALLTWGAAVQGRLRLAQADAARLAGEGDPVAVALLARIGERREAGVPLRSVSDLYRLWHRSPLSAEGYPAALAVWSPRGQPIAQLELAEVDLPNRLLQTLALSAVERRSQLLEVWRRSPGAYAVLARPLPDSTVLTVGIGPRSRLIPRFRIARLLAREPRASPPYEMSLSEVVGGAGWQPGLVWRREGQTIHGDERLELPTGVRRLHVALETGEPPGLLVRGALVLFLDAGVTALLWLFGEALRGQTDFINRIRELMRFRSYRLRIVVALAVFFIVPTVGFAAWMAGRIQFDARRSDDLVIRQSLRDASGALEEGRPGPGVRDALSVLADRAGAELLRYQSGALQSASAPLLPEMGMVDVYLPPVIYHELLVEEGGEAAADMDIAGRRVRAGFRAIGTARDVVLAMPLLADDRQPMSGEGDLGYALLLVTLVGLVAAGSLAGSAARSLAEPVGVLRAAAEAVGRGETPPPLGQRVPEEFAPVADAFTRMVRDVQASQAALEAARRRTVAVLRNVATGVIALNADLEVVLANPRAEELLSRPLEPGRSITAVPASDWSLVWEWVREFLRSGSELSGEELTVHGRTIRVRASALGSESGCVVALDDVTELTHAIRVLAWGEIARQVAHEIKNPLTPMRLGVQHLLRVHGERRGDFDEALRRTSQQILSEINRLDGVARAFARFGAPPSEEEAGPLVMVDLVAVARETAALYSLGGEGEVTFDTDGIVRGLARPDELREVLVNLVENARNARASRIGLAVRDASDGRVQVTVTDNGRGVRPEDLPRIFEPHFSTTTSGTGLGLAICKRLVNSWGGTIQVQSRVGLGTVVTVELPAA